ncbi:MAG TPA: ankyrin repeat domain-containing protein [Kofleriaceae bacterium]|nr:ankyrin repeat domain-containing protein [Kofleriaceae bacterium]
MRAYLDRSIDPPRLPADNALVARLRQARGDRLVRVVEEEGIDPNAVLAHETHIEPNHFNDNDPEWLYDLTTPLCEAYRAGDAEGVRALLERGALATRFVTLSDGSTASFKHTYVAYMIPEDAWTYRELLQPMTSGRAPAARLLERAFQRELDAAGRGKLAEGDRERALVCGLLLAIERGERKAIDRWLAAGADPTLGGPGGVTAIGLAIERGDRRVLEKLLEGRPGEAVEEICAWRLLSWRSPWDLHPVRPLHRAAARSDRAMIKYLLERGADPAAGFPKSYPLLAPFLEIGEGLPDRGCLAVLGAPTVRRLRETIGEAAMMEGLSDYWNRDLLAYLEGERLVPRAPSS